MSHLKVVKNKKNLLVASPVMMPGASCAFCSRTDNDELSYGKFYNIGDISCHYFCVLLSCLLVQKGQDNEGLLGFLYTDIIAEIERGEKLRCSYCHKNGATMGCFKKQCRKQFHYPCGQERGVLAQFFGTYRSYCKDHTPKQKIPENIMLKVKARRLDKSIANLSREKVIENVKISPTKEGSVKTQQQKFVELMGDISENLCVICYEEVEAKPGPNTFWPPCCARDSWFHRTCLQRMAHSAGMHFLKCPLCNDKDAFQDAVTEQGIFIPDRDAAWELEQNAFAEIYERPKSCGAQKCLCIEGRDYDAESGIWDLKICLLCGGVGAHAGCFAPLERFVCGDCSVVPPPDLQALEAMQMTCADNSAPESPVSRPIMPCRMSIRRTKPIFLRKNTVTRPRTTERSRNIENSRMQLGLRKPQLPQKKVRNKLVRHLEEKVQSPLKLLEEELYKKLQSVDDDIELPAEKRLEVMIQKIRKPAPLIARKKVVNKMIETILEEYIKYESDTKSYLTVNIEIHNKETKRKKYRNLKDETPTKMSNQLDNKLIDSMTHSTPRKSIKSNLEILNNKSNIYSEILLSDDESSQEKLCDTPFNKINIYSETPKDKINIYSEILLNDDESSQDKPLHCDTPFYELDASNTNTTFELSKEFIADAESNDSNVMFDEDEENSTKVVVEEQVLSTFVGNTDTVFELSRDFIADDLTDNIEQNPSNNKNMEQKSYNNMGKNSMLAKDSIKNNTECNKKDSIFGLFPNDDSVTTNNKSSNILQDNITTYRRRPDFDMTNDHVAEFDVADTGFYNTIKCDSIVTDDNVPIENIDSNTGKTKFDLTEKTDLIVEKQKNNKKLQRKRKSLKKRRGSKKYIKDKAKENVIDLTSQEKEVKHIKNRQSKKKKQHEVTIDKNEINLNFKWKSKEFKLKIRDFEETTRNKKSRKRKHEHNKSNKIMNFESPNKNLKQTKLNFSPEAQLASNLVDNKDKIKKKRIKLEPGHDNLKQTSIQSFFVKK